MSRGAFITFEGPDGSGKSTQIRLLADYLKERGHDVVMTREPGGTRIGERIRDLILDRGSAEMDPLTEALLYAASRAQHAAEVIRPALEVGRTTLCDRFVDSSIAYQGYGRGLGDVVRQVNEAALGGLAPDLTILMDIPPEACFERIGRTGGDRIESEAIAYHRLVYDAYLTLAEQNPVRIHRVGAARPPDIIHKDIRAITDAFFEARAR
jgi:dTMP kinase